MERALEFTIGKDYDGNSVTIELSTDTCGGTSHVLITGAPKENRTNLCKRIVESVITDYEEDTIKLFIYDSHGLYDSYYGQSNVTRILNKVEDLNELIDGLNSEIKNRIKLFNGYDICQYNKRHPEDNHKHKMKGFIYV